MLNYKLKIFIFELWISQIPNPHYYKQNSSNINCKYLFKNIKFNKINYLIILYKIMESQVKFVSYKKLLIFGNEGSGKTSLTKRLEKGSFQEESHF